MKVDFKVVGLKNTIKKIEKLETNSKDKPGVLVDKLAKLGQEVATEEFDSTVMFDSKGAEKTPDINVSVKTSRNARIIQATGEDVVYSEYGVGILNFIKHPIMIPGVDDWGHHITNFNPNNHLHKQGLSMGYSKRWSAKHGNAPSMAMYKATKAIKGECERTAKEVFK